MEEGSDRTREASSLGSSRRKRWLEVTSGQSEVLTESRVQASEGGGNLDSEKGSNSSGK